MAKIVDWDARIGGRVRLRDLHILLAVVQCGTMAKAAEQLGVSQPAVSEAIAGLEHALHIRRSIFGKPAKVIAAPKT